MTLKKTSSGLLVPEHTLGKREGLFLKGEYTLRKCTVDTRKAIALVRDVEASAKFGWSEYRRMLSELYRRHLSFEAAPIPNLVVNNGLEMLGRILSGDVTYTGVWNYCAFGDSNTAVNAADTQLGSEVYRKQVTSTTFSGNEGFASTFLNQSEDADTYEEIGHFIDGTGTTNSGRLFSRIEAADTVELPVTKSLTETLTVDYKVTFANA